MKRLLTIFLMIAIACSFAQGRRFKADANKGYSPKHPLFAALESDSFTPAERTRLKALAEKDMKAFSFEMKKHFMLRRKAEAEKILKLRQQVLDAKTPAEKKKATDLLRAELNRKVESRLAFHKKVLDETERNINEMQTRCNKLRKEYELRKKHKEQRVDKELQHILSAEPPEYLRRHAEWEPGKPLPAPAKRKK